MGQAVLDPNSGQQVFYPDNTSSDEIEHSMQDYTQGAIRAYKPSWYDTYIKDPLQKMGASIYDPVITARAAVAGLAEGLRPMVPQNPVEMTGKPFAPVQFKDESGGIAPSPQEQEMYQKVSPMAYNLGNFGGQAAILAGAAGATEGLSSLIEGVPAISKAFAGISSLVKAGTLSEEGVATGAAALKGAATFGAAGEVQSASKQQEVYGNIDWHQVAKDTAAQAGFGLVAGGVFGYMSKPLAEIAPEELIAHSSKLMMASGTVMAAQVKMSGGSNRDALLAFGGGALLAGLGLHGEMAEFREATLNELNDLKARYLVSQTGADESAARQAMSEHSMNDAEQVINESNSKVMESKPVVQKQIQGANKVFSDPDDPQLFNHLSQFIAPGVLVRMDDEQRLWLGNQPLKDQIAYGEIHKEAAFDEAKEMQNRQQQLDDDARRARGIPVDKTALDEVASSKELTTNLVAKTLNEVTGGGEKTTTRGEVTKEGSNASKSGESSQERGIQAQGLEQGTEGQVRVRGDEEKVGVEAKGGEIAVAENGQPKVTKSSEDISKELAKRGMAELSEQDKAHFESTSFKGKTEELSELMRTDPMGAEKIATGEQESSLSPSEKQLLFNMVKLKAFDENNVELGIKLAKSPINTERSEAAKTLGASGFDNGDFGKEIDPIKNISDVNKSRNPETSKTIAKKISGDIKKGIERVKKESVPKQSDFDKFIAKLRC